MRQTVPRHFLSSPVWIRRYHHEWPATTPLENDPWQPRQPGRQQIHHKIGSYPPWNATLTIITVINFLQPSSLKCAISWLSPSIIKDEREGIGNEISQKGCDRGRELSLDSVYCSGERIFTAPKQFIREWLWCILCLQNSILWVVRL